MAHSHCIYLLILPLKNRYVDRDNDAFDAYCVSKVVYLSLIPKIFRVHWFVKLVFMVNCAEVVIVLRRLHCQCDNGGMVFILETDNAGTNVISGIGDQEPTQITNGRRRFLRRTKTWYGISYDSSVLVQVCNSNYLASRELWRWYGSSREEHSPGQIWFQVLVQTLEFLWVRPLQLEWKSR